MTRETAPRGLRAGTLVAGRYALQEKLGSGAMGSVYRAVDVDLQRDVALKFPGALGAPLCDEQRARFEREARALAQLSHPAIVAIHDVGRSDDTQPFLVMELVRGESLSTMLQRRGALPWREAVQLGDAIADALHAAHEAGILHRDLKPSNIMFTPATSTPVRLIDFGLARLVSAARGEPLTESAYVMGTPGYIAPEYAWSGSVTSASDHYALGVVLFEMVAGVHPFASSPHDGAPAITRARVTWQQRTAHVPTSLTDLVFALLSPDPSARPPRPDLALRALRHDADARDAAWSPSIRSSSSSSTAGDTAARPMVEVGGGVVTLELERQRLIEVRVAPFAIDKHPVTHGDWHAYVTATGQAPLSSWQGAHPPRAWRTTPVTGVTFAQAQAFAAWAGRRLPTEAEWERAARGDDARLHPWGDTWHSGLSGATHDDEWPQRRPAPIGMFTPQGDSPFGLSDLLQLWEWVVAPYQPVGHVVRGGPWRDRQQPASLANRSWDDAASHDIGFRCARDPGR